jgi:hypothetical protein
MRAEETLFKEIERFPGYLAYSDGRIFSKKFGKFLKGSFDKQGYHRVHIYVGGYKNKTIKTHRLIAETFLPKQDSKMDVNHINGIKSDNRIENLEWCTRSQNILHAFRTGLKKIPDSQKVRFKKTFSKMVIDSETGKVYNSLKDAAVDLRINYSTLLNNFRPDRANNTNLKFIDKNE